MPTAVAILRKTGRLAVWLELTKLPISALSSLTATTGFVAGSGVLEPALVAVTLGTLLLAMGACALNQVQDRKLDALMERTRHRPIPRGAVNPRTASALALILMAAGFLILRLAFRWTPALLGLLAVGWYAGLYAPLKRVSAFAVIPGAFIGAIPPAMGWSAAGGRLADPALVALCFVFLLWQVPHFWLLSLIYEKDYARAAIPTLSRHFAPEQILRLILVWTSATVASCAFLPLFWTTTVTGAMLLLAAGSLWLVSRVVRLFLGRAEASRIREAFVATNVFALLVMIAVTADALGLG